MRFYLSSHKLGNETEKLKNLIPSGKKIGLIPNAIDYVEIEERRVRTEQSKNDLRNIGIEVEILDLQEYFDKKEELKKKIKELGGIWVRGGNTFVLRKAMALSGLDNILKNMKRRDFLYGGYSAGGCVLSPKLDHLQNVDKPYDIPYKDKEVIWEGLGLIDFAFLPHYKSDHPESKHVDEDVEYCKKNKISFKALRDGEVIIIE